MSTKEIKFVNVDEKLGKDKFFVDEENAHIVLCDEPDRKEFRKLVKACPANLYKEADDGTISFDCAGCLARPLRRHDPQEMGIPAGNLRRRIPLRLSRRLRG